MNDFQDTMFCERLTEILAKEGMSESEFAGEIGSQLPRVKKWMVNASHPNYKYLVRILNLFPGIDARWLITGRNDQDVQPQPESERAAVSMRRCSKCFLKLEQEECICSRCGGAVEVLTMKNCPHAHPHNYCEKCPVSPCPIGLGDQKNHEKESDEKTTWSEEGSEAIPA